MSSHTRPAPVIEVALEISPASYKVAEADLVPELTIKTTLAASCPSPVTILTWPLLFHPRLALKRRDFCCEDLSTDPPTKVDLEITKGPKRVAYSRKRGHNDEQYYMTLRPGETQIIKHPLDIVKRTADITPDFEPNHQYRLSVSDDGKTIMKELWWWGTADDILEEEDGPSKNVFELQGSEDLKLVTGSADFCVI